jgi:hypothetical protein
MRNQFYYQIEVTDEQVTFANALVEYSLLHHPVANIWDKKEDKKTKTKEYRFTGSLGEVVFADLYGQQRKTKAFGAIDGQDFGNDFQLVINDLIQIIDTKAMQRKSGIFYKNYVLNIPASQLLRKNSFTDQYYCISFHQKEAKWIASVLGFISKQEILDGNIGVFYKADTPRIRADGTSFQFNEDTYEVDFQDITSPSLSDFIKKKNNFKIKKLL